MPPTVRALLDEGRSFDEVSGADLAWSEGELRRIAESVRQRLEPASARSDALVAMREVVFGQLGFAREVDDSSLKYVFLPSVLRSRRGNCVGLGSLYLALGELVGVPLEGVMRPGHFYVRVRDDSDVGATESTSLQGGHRNVELLHLGEEMPDEWYEKRFPAARVSEYGRSLSLPEVLGILDYDVGNERRRQGRLTDARRAYERAVERFSELSEALASLGAAQHLLGDLDDAMRSYRAARRANPSLAGLDANVELLEQDGRLSGAWLENRAR